MPVRERVNEAAAKSQSAHPTGKSIRENPQDINIACDHRVCGAILILVPTIGSSHFESRHRSLRILNLCQQLLSRESSAIKSFRANGNSIYLVFVLRSILNNRSFVRLIYIANTLEPMPSYREETRTARIHIGPDTQNHLEAGCLCSRKYLLSSIAVTRSINPDDLRARSRRDGSKISRVISSVFASSRWNFITE